LFVAQKGEQGFGKANDLLELSSKTDLPCTLTFNMTQELIVQIKTAFENLKYPGDHDLTDSTYGEEPEALKRAFRGKTNWQTLDSDFLDQAPEGWSTALSFFSGRAFQFYLPAYLIADLQGQLPSLSLEFYLIYGLTTDTEPEKIADFWGGGTTSKRAIDRYNHLNLEQAQAVVAYLQWTLENFKDANVTQALQAYWLPRTATR
jgi:hypothetical protein